MPIVKPPTVVQNAMDEFIARLFINLPQRDHAANDLPGLMICPNKTITGMTGEQPHASDPSCLNPHHHKTTRTTEVDQDSQQLNEERIRWLQNFDDMNFHETSAEIRVVSSQWLEMAAGNLRSDWIFSTQITQMIMIPANFF